MKLSLGKGAVLGILVLLIAVAFGSMQLTRSEERAEAAPPFPVVAALAPDIYEFFIDGNGSVNNVVFPPTGLINPLDGLNVGEVLVGDQSALLGGNLDFLPDPAESGLLQAFGDKQINTANGGGPTLDGSLAIAVYLDGTNLANVTFAGPAGTIWAEAVASANPAPPTGATCGSGVQYAVLLTADIPDGDCDGVTHGTMDYNSDADGDTLLDEDPVDGIDNDADTLVDEDPPVTPGACIGLVAPVPPAVVFPNDPTCREDGLVLMHMLLAGMAPGPGVVSVTQGAEAGMVSFTTKGPAVAYVPIALPDGPNADPLSAGGTAPVCPQPLTSGSVILNWAATAPTDPTLSQAIIVPTDGVGPLTRQTVAWSSSDQSLVGAQEASTLSFFVPPLPGVDPLLIGQIIASNLFCSGGAAASENVTAAGAAMPLVFPVTVTVQPAVRLDFDITNGSGPCDIVDPSASIGVGQSVDVAVCMENLAEQPAAFDYEIRYDDSIVTVPEVADAGTGLDDNPDANAGTTTFGATDLGTGWDCSGGGLKYPTGDTVVAAGAGNGLAISGGCSSVAGPYTLGTSGVLGVMTVDGAAVGTTTLDLEDVVVTGESGLEAGSCNPAISTGIVCVGGSIEVTPEPTATPTATNTPEPTATNTPTATATPAGPTINKSPASANLFLCEGPTCDESGEGFVTLDEIVNVPADTGDQDGDTQEDGVGAYEFQVKFDHKIFNVEITDGEFLTRTGRVANCSHTVVTENWILFGCTTTATPPNLPGAAGQGDANTGVLAHVTLTPNEDMKFRLHPGNDNGVVRMILDENCELANIFGEPIAGSINGGLTLECGDAAVTVRILEGDLNLDCTVDVLDQQAIAFRYGAFFGNLEYDPWYDMEPALKDFDIDIKDLQKVYGRDGSTCENPVPPQPPAEGLSVGPL